MWRSGGCHCGVVRFEAHIPDGVEAHACNCSMCARLGFLHLIVPESRFRLIAGAEALRSYRFNTGLAEHLFCERCGVKSFYRPRSNPDGWSVNLRCLDDPAGVDARIAAFDGRNWEAHAGGLAHLSQEPGSD
ncbi:MAG: GFA family protein [Hyphomonadaceae bacterium]|nr:GFA family protein [Hyphomonadaceae bacterium]